MTKKERAREAFRRWRSKQTSNPTLGYWACKGWFACYKLISNRAKNEARKKDAERQIPDEDGGL